MINPKRTLIYGIISITIIVIIIAIYTTPLFRSISNKPVIRSTIQSVASSNSPSIGQFKNQFCGPNSIPYSNNYMREYTLPHDCEMPLGLAVDSQAGRVWYVSTQQGTVGDYNLITKKFDKETRIPGWNVRKNPMDFSNIWSVKSQSQTRDSAAGNYSMTLAHSEAQLFRSQMLLT